MSYNKALAINPNNPAKLLDKGVCKLMLGQFEEGWKLFEWRWNGAPELKEIKQRTFDKPLWLGDAPLAGQTILLHAEQGLGDTIQFCRYV